MSTNPWDLLPAGEPDPWQELQAESSSEDEERRRRLELLKMLAAPAPELEPTAWERMAGWVGGLPGAEPAMEAVSRPAELLGRGALGSNVAFNRSVANLARVPNRLTGGVFGTTNPVADYLETLARGSEASQAALGPEPQGLGEKLVEFAGGMPEELAKLGMISAAGPGGVLGTAGAFGAEAGLEALGAGATPEDIAKATALAAGTGLAFGGVGKAAAPIANPVLRGLAHGLGSGAAAEAAGVVGGETPLEALPSALTWGAFGGLSAGKPAGRELRPEEVPLSPATVENFRAQGWADPKIEAYMGRKIPEELRLEAPKPEAPKVEVPRPEPPAEQVKPVTVESAVERAVREPREVSEQVAIATKQQTKDTLNEAFGRGEVAPEAPIRFTSVDELNRIVSQGRLEEAFLGEGGLSAQTLSGGKKPALAYGANDRISAAIIFPEDASLGIGKAPNELIMDPRTDVSRLRFIIDGKKKLFTFQELQALVKGQEMPAQNVGTTPEVPTKRAPELGEYYPPTTEPPKPAPREAKAAPELGEYYPPLEQKAPVSPETRTQPMPFGERTRGKPPGAPEAPQARVQEEPAPAPLPEPKPAQEPTRTLPPEPPVQERQIAVPRSPETIIRQEKEKFPDRKAQYVPNQDGTVEVRLPGGSRYFIGDVDEIPLTQAAIAEHVRRNPQDAGHEAELGTTGRTQVLDGNLIVDLARGFADDVTRTHEGLHVARKLGLVTGLEWKTATSKYAKDVTELTGQEEAVASALAGMDAGAGTLRGKITFRLNQLGEWLKQVGHKIGFISDVPLPNLKRLAYELQTGRLENRTPEQIAKKGGADLESRLAGKVEAPPAVQGKMHEIKRKEGEKRTPEEAIAALKKMPVLEGAAKAREGVREEQRRSERGGFSEPTTTVESAAPVAAAAKAAAPRGGKPPSEYLNISKITDEKSAQAALEALIDSYPEPFEATSRPRTWQDVVRKSGLFTTEDVKRIVREQGYVNDKIIVKTSDVASATAGPLIEAAQKLEKARAEGGGLDDAENDWLAVSQKSIGLLALAKEARTEAGRALNIAKRVSQGTTKRDVLLEHILDKTADPKVIAELAKMDPNSPDPTLVFDIIRAANKPGITDMIQEAGLAFMMSGVKTVERNLGGNAIFNMMKLPVKAVSSALDAIYVGGKRGGTERQRYIGEIAKETRALREGLPRAWKDAVDAFQEKGAINWGRIEATHLPAIPGKLGKGIRVPLRIAGMGDAFFGSIAEQQEIAAQAYRRAKNDVKAGKAGNVETRMAEILKHIEDYPHILKAAQEERTYRVFQKELGPLGRKIMGLLNHDFPVIHKLPRLVVAPFFKTPVNLLKAGLEHSPVGLAASLMKIAVGGKTKGIDRYKNRGAAEDALAKGIVGSLIAGGIYALVADKDKQGDGIITGMGPKDPNKKSNKMAYGWQPYAVRVGDHYFSYQGWEPLSSLLMQVANLEQALNEKDREKRLGEIFRAAKEVVLNKTAAVGFLNLTNAVGDPERYFKQYLQQVEGIIIPTLASHIAQAMDPYIRRKNNFWDVWKSRTPGMGEDLEKRYTATGQPVKREQTPLETVAAPYTRTDIKPAPVEREMDRIGYVPSQVPRTKLISGKRVKLTREEYSLYTQANARAAARIYDELLNDPDYQGLPDQDEHPGADSKKKRIARIYSEERAEATRQILEGRTE